MFKEIPPEYENLNDFETNKKKATDFLEVEKEGKAEGRGFNINEGALDENVRELVSFFNQLPFLYTEGSCGGHIMARGKTRDQLTDTDLVNYAAGDLVLNISSNDQGLKFIKTLDLLIEKFPEASFTCLNPKSSVLTYVLKFGREIGRKRITFAEAKELEESREKFKEELMTSVNQFLN